MCPRTICVCAPQEENIKSFWKMKPYIQKEEKVTSFVVVNGCKGFNQRFNVTRFDCWENILFQDIITEHIFFFFLVSFLYMSALNYHVHKNRKWKLSVFNHLIQQKLIHDDGRPRRTTDDDGRRRTTTTVLSLLMSCIDF